MNENLMIMCDSWKDQDSYRYRVKNTINHVKATIKKPEKASISFSGGKDSIVMLHLITRIFPEINVWHWDYGIFMPRMFEIEILKNMQDIAPHANIVINKRQSTHPSSVIGYKEFYDAIKNNIKRLSLELIIVGLRKEESNARKNRLSKGKFECYANTRTYFPISDWRWQDVWTYIHENDLKYPTIYNTYGPLFGWDKVRFVTFFDPEFTFLGGPNIDTFFIYDEKNV